ncbi:mucin-5AC-like [Mercenaria mercenaria]|uniref:mucin-5AC-like n=1 Tax=Mercenaria mercenaria TaxID=6596 RepID=UPI00234ED2D6|nr:mucin-5AC-like [Mercenaria mercenaria]
MTKLMLLNIVAVVLAQIAGVKTEARRQLNGTASCDRFPDFCPIQCTAIDAMGCLVCNCNVGANNTDSSSARSSSANSSGSQTSSNDDTTGIEQNGRSQTSASSSNNMAGCPKLPDNCNFDCLTIGSNGCIVCTCTNGGPSVPLAGGATLTSSGKTSQSGHGSERPITSAANNSTTMTNVQSPFSITANGAGTGSSGTSGTSAQASQNNNGCPVFSNNCDASCVSLDTNGCPVCVCASGGTSSSSSMTSSSAGSNLNGCPPFTTGCTANCVDLDTNGCPVCRCHHTGPGSPSASRNNTSPATSGKQTAVHASSNNNGCPAFPTNCRTDCVDLTSLGCPVCTCTTSGSGSTATGSTSSFQGQMNNNNGCPAFQPNCPAECTTTSDNGCPVCACSSIPSYPQYVTSGNSATTTQSSTSGENYKKQQTGHSVVTTTTNIPVTTSTSSSSGSGGSASGGSNTNGTGSSSGTSSGSGNGGAITCPAFDGAHCNPTCIGLDGNGCLSCDCGTEVTTPSNSASTTKASIIPGGGDGTTFAPGSATGSGTKGGQTSTGSSGGDFTTFAPSIAVTGQSSNDTKGSGSAGTSGNGNGCPAYDTTCPATCTSLDVRGCPQCSCPGVTTPKADTSPDTSSRVTTTPLPSTTKTLTTRINVIYPATTQAPLTQHGTSTSAPLATQPSTTQPSITQAPPTQPRKTQAPTIPPSTAVSTTSQTSKGSTVSPGVCPPIRCVYPCDAGVTLGADNCPVCTCRADMMTSKPTV